jgi:mannose/fructose/N-acetylgalactosamine-specific phosphotransferase system component IIC
VALGQEDTEILPKSHCRAFDSLVLCVVWNLWLHRNVCVSRQATAFALTVIQSVLEAIDLWVRAGLVVGSQVAPE